MVDDLFPHLPTGSYVELLKNEFHQYSHLGAYRPTAEEWTACEQEIGKRFPEDYKQVVSFFGVGRFGDSIWVHGPGAPREDIRLSRANLEVIHRRFSDAWPSCSFYPEPLGLVMFGMLSARMLICFQDLPNFTDQAGETSGEICLIDGDSKEVVQAGFAEFLFRIATNRPPMRGPISSRFHAIFFSDPQTSFFRLA